MATTKKKTTKKKATTKKEEVVKNKSFIKTIVTDVIEFHKVKDGCTLVLILMEGALLWKIASTLISGSGAV
tara:strand:- start:1300 stop:1512 length:213 start_codon:yes stop_codon:yes gene_type:complete